MNWFKKCTILAVSSVLIASCTSEYSQDADGFDKLQMDLQDKFGKNAYYTIVNMSAAGDEMMGYIISVDKTENAEDLRQERWVKDGGSWYNAGYANMQIDERNPAVYKFQLGKEVELKRLGALIETSKNTFIQEGKGDKPIMKLAIVNTNNTVTDESGRYQYTIKLAQSGTNDEHSYTYDRNGKFIRTY